MMEVGMFEKPMRFFDDDGTEINPDLIAKPSLCASCEKDEDSLKEIHAHFDTLITKIDQNV